MPIELQITLIWFSLVIVLFLIIILIFAHSLFAELCFVFGGFSGLAGACIGEVTKGPDFGAFLGMIVGSLIMITLFIYSTTKRVRETHPES